MFKILYHIPHTLFASDILSVADITKTWWSCPNTVILPFHPLIFLEYVSVAAPHFIFFIFVIIQIFCLFMIILCLLWGVRKLKWIYQFPGYAKVHAEYHCRTYFLRFCLYMICFFPDFWLPCKPRALLASTFSFRKFSSLSFFTYNFFSID